ncbi:putative uncharacterized protein DDB_G0282133 [Halyomorpha halys]|uniref:putative uncharacterized protein DDB_G0282133 n=1 Tax=Halyomorpha halys TaxID=286706 RepID=UPI0006D4F476|nr:homeobox protein 2 [Halyomorpha halys]
MNSFRTGGLCENNVTNIDVSQCSGDLFQESPQLECEINNSFKSDVNFSNEKSSETSDESYFTPVRKPRRALSFSYDSSHCNSKNSDSLQNESNTDSSKFFKPISPVCKIDKSGSTSLLEVNQSNSPDAYVTPRIHHLSKVNVAGISFVSESEHSESSSILDDSLKGDNHQSSIQFFKTPLCSSVKKRTIQQWLNNVSLNCSPKPNQNGPHNRHEVVPPKSNILEDQNGSKPLSVNVCVPSSVDINIGHAKTNDVKESETLNGLGTGNLNDSDRIEESNTSENYCPWLFDSFGNKRSECSTNQDGVCHMLENHKLSNEVNDDNCQNSPNKSSSFTTNYKLSKHLDRSFHEDSGRIISKKSNHSLSFNKSSCNYKSENGNVFSTDDSDANSNEICNGNLSKIVESDDSFTKIRMFKKKKKKNCLNISSDDSEAKDTANDSEDTHHNNEPYTPRRRLYFRNPLNNSLDDDAKPLTYCKDYSISSKDNSRFISKNTGLLDQICSEVHNISNSSMCSLQNLNNSNDKSSENSKDVESEPAVFHNLSVQSTDLSFSKGRDFSKSTGSVSHDKSSSVNNLDISQGKADDVNQLNFSGLSIGNTSKKDYDIPINTSNKEEIVGSIDESQIDEVFDSSNSHPNELEDSSDSIINIKRKSKKNILNFSSDESSSKESYFLSEKPNPNIIDVNEISNNEPNPSKTANDQPEEVINISPRTKVLVDLTQSDDEYDKYMYRTRSDSSFSDSEEIQGVSKDSSDVISVHTTTSDEEGDDEENEPWFDLESYLKKNIPASTKSLDSSFLKNSEKRRARLAKITLPTHSSCPDHTSFLLSLTPEVPDEMCHPEAVKYRGQSFSKHRNELVDLLFKLYNKEIFNEKLPPLEIKWSGHLTTTSGITKSSSKITKNGKIRQSTIKLSKTVVDDASKVRDVLLHELCHAANWLIDEQAGGHGPLFKKWVNKIWIKFPEVPKVKTTHSYELKWKYRYKCSYCSYELGKMKLSLTETSCRLCGGLVTVNT